jgi:hypothetical protein
MSFDPSTGRVIVFGGTSADGTGLGDTWAWDGSRWTQVADMGPARRANAAMATTGRGVVLFEGTASAPGAAEPQTFGDTWLWQAGSWRQVQDMGPPARSLPALAFHPEGRLTLFGGFSAGRHALGDTWERAGDPTQVDPPRIGAPRIVPEGARLAGPGDQLTVVFSVENIPPEGAPIHVGWLLPVGGPAPVVPGLAFSGPGRLAPGATTGEITITRGTEPLEPGLYALELLPDGAPYGSGFEQQVWFEVV